MNEFLSFRKFVTPLIIQIIFWIGVVMYALAGLAMIVMGAMQGFGPFIVGLLLGIIVFAVGSLLVRIWCELLILLFKIYDELVAIRTGKMPEGPGAFPVIQTPAQAQTPPGMG